MEVSRQLHFEFTHSVHAKSGLGQNLEAKAIALWTR